ncbi:hypothetical protein TWF506_002566 [Arthrobotrys conoides]|uniref:Uncharacterized protein n=1 Tax=Arthrobotrys conoides TaxID=74498 RepID=A0AAN8NII9_9PEZI
MKHQQDQDTPWPWVYLNYPTTTTTTSDPSDHNVYTTHQNTIHTLRLTLDEIITTITSSILTHYPPSSPKNQSKSKSTSYISLTSLLKREETLLKPFTTFSTTTPSFQITPHILSTIKKNPGIFPRHTLLLNCLNTLGIYIKDWNLIRYLKFCDPVLLGTIYAYKEDRYWVEDIEYLVVGLDDGYEGRIKSYLEVLPPPVDQQFTKGVLRLARIADRLKSRLLDDDDEGFVVVE